MKRPTLEQFLAWRAALHDHVFAKHPHSPHHPPTDGVANLAQLDRWLAKKAAKARRREARQEDT